MRQERVGISRIVAVVIVVVIVAVGGGVAYFLTSTPTQAQQNVNFILDYTPYGLQVPLYTLAYGGYAGSHNLKVNLISNPQGSGGAFSALAAGKADLGLVDTMTYLTLMARQNTTNLRIVGSYVLNSESGVFFKTSENITKPSDLNGKVICTTTGGADYYLWPAFAKNAGLNAQTSTSSYLTQLSIAAAVPDLISGKCDALVLFTRIVTDLHVTDPSLKISMFNFSDYGLDTLGQSIVANTQFMSSHPTAITNFMAALQQATQYSVNNPTQASNYLVSNSPSANISLVLPEWQDWTLPLMGGSSAVLSSTSSNTFGYVNPTLMSKTMSITEQAYGITLPPPSSVYTEQFVKAP